MVVERVNLLMNSRFFTVLNATALNYDNCRKLFGHELFVPSEGHEQVMVLDSQSSIYRSRVKNN